VSSRISSEIRQNFGAPIIRRLAHVSHRRGRNEAGRGNGVVWTLSRDFRAGEKCERCGKQLVRNNHARRY